MRIVLSFVLAVLLATPVFAEKSAVPDSPVVKDTIAALQSGDMDELDWMVSHVGSLQFYVREFSERSQVFHALSGCKAKEIERKIIQEYKTYTYQWACDKEKYRGRLVLEKAGKSVAFVDIFPKAQFKQLERKYSSISIPPPPIGPLSNDGKASLAKLYAKDKDARLKLANTFAEGLIARDLSALALGHGAYTAIPYGFYNPFLDQLFVDKMFDLGKTRAEADIALADAVDFIHSQHGVPTKYSCSAEVGEPIARCTWTFEGGSTRLNAKMYIRDPESYDRGYKIYWFRYDTDEKLIEAEKRANING